MLRLAYAGGTDGVTDAAGDLLGPISLSSGERGNVADGVGAPQLIGGITNSATQVDLFFSEPITTADADSAASDFQITDTDLYFSPSGASAGSFTAAS